MLLQKRLDGPTRLVFWRHLPSDYTARKVRLHTDFYYDEFQYRYEYEYYRSSPSVRLQHLAQLLRANHPRVFPDPYPTLANPDDAKVLGAKIREKILNGELTRPDIIVVAPTIRTWLTFAGIQSAFPGLLDGMNRKQTIIDLGNSSQKRLKEIVNSQGLMVEDRRVSGKNYGNISQYPEEKIFFALNWREQRKLAQYRDLGEFWYRPPGGENISSVMKRLDNWKQYISKKYPGQVIWIFGQLDTILAFTVLIKDLPIDQAAEEFVRLRRYSKPIYGGATYFSSEIQGKNLRYILQSYNQNLANFSTGFHVTRG